MASEGAQTKVPAGSVRPSWKVWARGSLRPKVTRKSKTRVYKHDDVK